MVTFLFHPVRVFIAIALLTTVVWHWQAQSASAGEATSTPVECRWTDEPITINGRADEPAWKQAVAIDDFRLPGPAVGKPRTATRAKLLWDREYLYFYAEMDDADLIAKVTEHNGQIGTDDAFELFLKPDSEKSGYYEFGVNAAGTTLEIFYPAREAGGYERCKDVTKIEMKTAVRLRGTLNHSDDKDKRKDEGWSVEGRIRWRDLAPTAGRPDAGEVWRFALCRVDASSGKRAAEMSSPAPLTKADFHNYEDYLPLKFVGPDSLAAAPARPLWTTSHVIGSPDPPQPYTVVRAYPKLTVKQPLYLLEEPGTAEFLLLQHLGSWVGPGKLLRFKNDPNVSTVETLLSFNRIAYGMTLHPDFVHNGYIYLMSNGREEGQESRDRISRFTIDPKPPHAIDPASEKIIIEWDSGGHNGGDLAFGPDGYLYHASGDGSTDSDANLRGQDIAHLNAAMIRIDVDHPDGDKAYSVPKDNPFVNTPGARPEIWAYGFRNPWRLAFDRVTGDLWVGQNGQDMWEQVYLVHKGENYGWSVYEGSHPFNLTRKRGPTPITFPIVDHPHSEMRSLTGGVVYRGDKLPELRGAFIYGDWSTGRIWGVKHDGPRVTWNKELARTTLQITGFRETAGGDLLVIDHGGGFYYLEPTAPAAPTPPFPKTLSATGLFLSPRDNRPDPALIPYDVNSPLWSDGALKQRFIALPGDGKIDAGTSHGWNFPEGTVLVKTFSLETEAGNAASRRRIETRLLTKQLGQWAGYSYRWNDDQSDATLVAGAGEDVPFAIADPAAPNGRRTQTWHYPSRTECMVCHTRAANFVLGPSLVQMNKDVADDHGVKRNQLETLERFGVLRLDYMSYVREAVGHHWPGAETVAMEDGGGLSLFSKSAEKKGTVPVTPDVAKPNSGKVAKPSNALPLKTGEAGTGRLRLPVPHDAAAAAAPLPQREAKPTSLLPLDPAHLPRLVDPYDAHADLNLRARSYLHANCAICHVLSGGGNALMNLEYDVPADQMKALNERAQHEAFGLPHAHLITPGHPDSSILLHRLATRGPGQMPPLASSRVDERAIELFKSWIVEMHENAADPKP